MKKFINDLKKYKNYILYAAKSDIKSEIANSYLGWLWILLDPLLFMLIYTFVSVIVFGKSEPYFAAFTCIGLSIWKFFNRGITSSVRLVATNKDIVTKVYVPKFVLLFIDLVSNFVKMIISFSLVAIFMLYYHVNISFYILYIIPIIIVLFLFTFGISLFFMHFGVFVEDLTKVVPLALRLVFYMSGVFFSLKKRVPAPYGKILLTANPIAFLISTSRDVLLYSTAPNLLILGIWLIISLILIFFGIKLVYKYENTYVKVMRA